MATQGTYAAYRQLKPLEGDVSQDMQQQDENAFRRRAEKRLEEKTAQDKADKAQKEKQDLWDKHVKPLSNYDTGSKSLNEVQGKLLINAQKEYVPLMEVIQNAKSTDEDRLKATLKLQNINQLPERMQAMTKALTDRDVKIKEGIAKGNLWDNPDYTKNYQEGWENKMLVLDDSGNPMIAFKNPDGSTDLETYDQISQGINKYDFTPKFDRDKELTEASAKLQPTVNQTDDGVKRVETTAIDPDSLKSYVSSQLFQSDGVTPTEKMKSFAKEAGIAMDDTDGLQKIADRFGNDIKLRVKGGVKTTRNYSALDAQKEANDQRERAQKRADEKEKTNEDLGTENVNRVGVVKGNTPKAGGVLKNMNGAIAYSVQGSNLERSIGAKGAYERTKSIYVLPNGSIALEVDRVDGTVTDEDGNIKSSNTTAVLYRSDQNANEVADFITKKKNPKTGKYYKNISEFKKDALGVGDSKPKQKAQTDKKKPKIDY